MSGMHEILCVILNYTSFSFSKPVTIKLLENLCLRGVHHTSVSEITLSFSLFQVPSFSKVKYTVVKGHSRMKFNLGAPSGGDYSWHFFFHK